MSLSAIFILDSQGKKLIYRDYRGDLPSSCIDKFYKLICEQESESTIAPVFCHNDINYLFIKHNNLYFVAVSNDDSNALMALSFLYKLTQVLQEYFGSVEDESVRDNFVLIYEILDEIMDFGYPQLTEPEVLKSYIFESAQKMEILKAPPAATNAVSWRKEGIKYSNNNIYLDVEENVNTLVNSEGIVLNDEIYGKILVNSCISGMPEVKIAFNDRMRVSKSNSKREKYVELEDAKFHQCVRLANFEKDRTISFIPPDGKFELMSYRIQNPSIPPFMITCNIEGTSDCTKSYFVKLESTFTNKRYARFVEVHIPVPSDSYSPSFATKAGTCVYAPENRMLVWRIKSFEGKRREELHASVLLPSIHCENSDKTKPNIRVKFEIVNHVISEFRVQYLKVFEKSGYSTKPWVRYLSTSGEYEFRT